MAEEDGNNSTKTVGKKILKGLTKTFTVAAGFIVGGYVGSLIFDPYFFSAIHDPNNFMAHALVDFMKDNFGFIHEFVGLTGDGGILRSDFVQNTIGLGEYMQDEAYTPDKLAEVASKNSDVIDNIANQSGGDIFGNLSAEFE